MQQAGYEKGFAATMMAPNNRYIEDARIAEAVAAMLAKIKSRSTSRPCPRRNTGSASTSAPPTS